MFDTSSASISIGGVLPSPYLAALTEAVEGERVGPDYDDRFPDREAIAAYVREAAATGANLYFARNEVRGGHFEGLEGWLRNMGLSYFRRDDGCATYGATAEFWEAGMDAPLCWPCDGGDGMPLLRPETVRELMAAGTLGEQLAVMERAWNFGLGFALDGPPAGPQAASEICPSEAPGE